ncbi:MAG: hypothetical protein M3Y50_06850 [Acidobacteriota bacterium]|nr:hypothetical protein [Acidobacteriota bacterium]
MRRIRPVAAKSAEPWLADFHLSLSRSGLAPLSIRAYRHDVGLFYRWLQTIKPVPIEMNDLNSADLLSYRQAPGQRSAVAPVHH